MRRSRLSKAKKYLAHFKPIENEREEGFEGHQHWKPDDEQILTAQAYFYHAVKYRYSQEVQSFLGLLLPGGSEDPRIPGIQRLLTNLYSEDSLKEALLLSISVGSRPLVEFILCLFIDCPYLERSGCPNSTIYPPHMTPLMLACNLNNYSIVQCLLLRGHHIEVPHAFSCDCEKCCRETISTRWEQRLVDTMRAISSDAFMWLASTDVYVMACRVAQDIGELIDLVDAEHTDCFIELELNVRRFMARIGDQVWRADEYDELTCNPNHCSNRTSEMPYPRIEMAMDAKMKLFVASSNTQTAIKAAFEGDWCNHGRNSLRDSWRMIRCTILMPFLAILHAFVPSLATTMANPMARFFAHVTTYTWFLMACILRPTIGYSNDWSLKFNGYTFAVEVYMYVYIVGLMLEKGMLYYRIGPASYYSHWWRWLDAMFIVCTVLSGNCLIWASFEREAFDPTEVDRVHWPYTEPILFHEVFLSTSCILGILKIFYYLQFSKRVGGSIISVGKCVSKLHTYLLIMTIVIISFAVGISGIIGPYVHRKQLKQDLTDELATTQTYSTFTSTAKNLFWTTFGYMGPSTYIATVGNAGESMQPMSHPANFFIFELLAAIFHGIIIITVLNLMTSLLVKKADEVLDNEEMEYKYTHAAMITEYLSWETAAPPPFNLLLVPLHWVHRRLFDRFFASPTWKEKPEKDPVQTTKKQEDYMDLLLILFNRFVGSKMCKYKSIFRTEFDKEEHRPTHVQSLNIQCRTFPADNKYQGFKHRMKRTMRRTPPYVLKGDYQCKSLLLKNAIKNATTRQKTPEELKKTELPPVQKVPKRHRVEKKVEEGDPNDPAQNQAPPPPPPPRSSEDVVATTPQDPALPAPTPSSAPGPAPPPRATVTRTRSAPNNTRQSDTAGRAGIPPV